MSSTAEKKYSSTLEWVNEKIDTFLATHKEITPARFGHLVLGDTGLVARLKGGGDITTRKLDILIRFFSNLDYQRKLLCSGDKI